MATVKTKQRRKSMSGKDTVKVLEFMENQIRMMRNANRLGTAYNYEKTKKNLTEFLEGVDILFTKVDEQLFNVSSA